jgi:amino acid adenylation domain-containing protein
VADTFARLGGDSLSLMRLVSYTRARGYFVDVKRIHQGLALKQMAPLLVGQGTGREVREAPTVEPFSMLEDSSVASLRESIRQRCHVSLNAVVDIYPLSPMQMALIALSAKIPGSYTNKITFELERDVDLDQLEGAVRQAVEHQEILRTVFVANVEGLSVQAVLRHGPVIQRRTCPKDTGEFFDNGEIPQVHAPAAFYLEKTDTCVYLSAIIHHAAMDGASLQMLADDLHCAYSSQPLPERPAYRTFIKHLETIHSKDDSRKMWKAFLNRPLPTQAPTPEILEIMEQPGQRKVQVKMPSLTESEWSSSEILVAALALLLRQTSGTSSVCFGLVLSGRMENFAEIENIAGPTLTTIPMICDVEPMSSKETLLRGLREDLQNIRTHEQFGLRNISKLNDCARQAASFTTLMVIQPKRKAKELRTFSQYTCEALRPTTQHPLEIECELSEDAAEVIMAYDGKVVGATQADWLINHFKRIIEKELCGNTELMEPFQDTVMLTDEDENQIDAWNSTVIELETRPLHACFSETAAKHPERVAVVSHDMKYTYAELDRLSSILARHLISHGVNRCDMVPLMFEKSAIVIVAILAVLKTGAAYVPLDPLHPRARLQSIKNDIGADIVLCSPPMRSRCQLWDNKILLDHFLLLQLQSQEEHYHLTSTVSPEDPAYIMFTSGSSGQPKGVVISHGAASTSIRDQVSTFAFAPGTRIMNFCSYTFDVSVMEIFATLSSGATLFVPSEEDRTSHLAQYMHDKNIQTAILTPTVVRSFLTPERVPSLQQLILVGEPCSQNLISEWSSRVQLINDYGPTETTIDSATNTDVTENTKATNVGKPISGHLWITRESDPGQLCPLGVAGELLISGPTLATGYLYDPKRTSQAFLDGSELPWTHKMTAKPRRLYKTGDLARYSPNGEIHILGRIDSQVKLKGLRIEVQEIEHVLELFDASLRAGVVLTKLASGEDSLLAVVSKEEWRRGSESSILEFTGEMRTWVDELFQHFARLLPVYMRPAIIVPLTNLPTNVSGKLDRRKLGRIAESLGEKKSTLYQSQPSSNDRKTTVISQAESDLRDQWAQILGVDVNQIYPDSSFFSMGGDSLTAMKLSSEYDTNRRLSVKSIFQHPTLGAMAKAIDTVALGEATAPDAAIRQHCLPQMRFSKSLFENVAEACNVLAQEIEDVYPCSPLQESLFAASLLSSGSYQARIAFDLAPEVDFHRLCASWEAVYQKHPILRTRIVLDHQERIQYLQVVMRQQLRWRTVDTEEAATERPEVTLGGELAQWTLLNGRVRQFVLFIHHALYDDVTLGVIFSDFAQLYTKGYLETRPSFFGMKHYIGFLESLDESGMIKVWKSLLAGANALPFPPRKSPDYKPLTDRASQTLTARAFDGDSWRSDQTTLLRAAWMLTIARYQHAVSDGESVCFGTVLSGRTTAASGLEEVAGPMILSVPVVETVKKTDSLSDFLGRVREKYVRAMDCGFLGLQKIRSIGPDQASACNFNNLFVIQNGENEEDFLQKERVEGFNILKRELHHPYGLVLECNFTATGINFSASYDSALLDEVAMYRLLDHFGTAFERLTELHGASTAKVSDILSRLSGDAEVSLVEAWNEQPATPECLLHERFLAIAQEWPTREAVFAHDRSLTYEELDGESSSLAYELIDLGVQDGSMVPICFEKSSYMLVALLAILKAGGAYVPISPDHPRKRQEYIIEKCSARVILASTDQVGLLRDTLGTDKTLLCVDKHFFKCHPALKTLQPPRRYTSPTSKSLAYVLYTSGSTGTPKGVVLSHGAVALSMVRHAERFGHALGDSVRSLQFCDYTFDVSIMDIFPTLNYGGCVCIPSEADRHGNISSFINKSRAEMAMLTPTIADMLDPAEVPTLRTLVVGGEPMTESVRNKWTDPANTPMRVLYNVYGPTEASVNVSASHMTSKSKASIIGSAVLGSQLWIAEPDETDRLTPLGCVGELLITGSCLADGYLNAPDQTAKAFIKAPTWLPTRFGSTAYRTGDLARFAANGEIELVGRIDAQVKIHGIRIELGEIEEVACRVEHVKSAVTIFSKTRGREELSLFYDAAQEQQSDLRKALHEQLIGSLPPAFIPSMYIYSAIPMTRTGKIDRKALARQLEGYRPEELRTFAINASDSVKRSPETKKQKELRILWIRALRVGEEDVWLDTNFFSIGGDSVAVIELVSMMQRAGYPVTYKDVYARPTLENMALLMQKAGEEYNTPVDPEPFEILAADPGNRHGLKTHLANALGISTDRIRDAYPCSAMQTSLIAASLRNPKAYWCIITLELASGIDVERLLSSWGAVVMHNAILRTVIVNTEDFGNIQVVIDADPWKSIGECREDVQLLGQPLSRYSLGTSRAGQKVFQLTMHHAIYDLWVQEALLEQLSQLYNGGRVKSSPSFGRFIRFQQQADDSTAFWKNAMQGASVVKFPNCRIVQDANEVFMTLSAERPMMLSHRRTSAHSLATIIHCAYALVLSRYGYMSDVCFPSVQSGRNVSLQDASNIVGPLMTTSFFRGDCSHDRTVNEMLETASKFFLDATNHQHAAHTVVPQLFDQSIVDMGSMLVVQPRARVSESRSNLFSRTSAEMAQPGLLLVLATIEEENKVTLRIQYASEAMEQGDVQLLLSHLQQAIVQLAEPDMGAKRTLGSITLLTEKDEQIAMRGCGMAMPSSTETVADVMWRIAEKDPNAVAVKAHDGTLTYGQLRDQASRLAALLRRRLMTQAGREVRIAACSERNAMAVVMQAAIFTVQGAALITLDPTSPVERNFQILEDSEADIVLVSPFAMEVAEQIARGREVLQISRQMLDELPADDGSDSTDAKPQGDNVAYFIYTSGSTGRPKGCIMEHGPLAITISKLTEFKEIDANVNTLWASTWSFDVHLSQIWEPLTTGGVICVPSEAEMHKSAEATLVKYDVNHAFFTPTQANMIDFSKTPCVRSIAMGGEPISFNLAPIFKAGIRIFNEYGPSEAAGCVTGHELTLGDQEKNMVGRALFGNCWAVEPGNPCRLAPIGTIGELVAGGTLARGYLNRPELTREAFFESPAWARDVCPRLYRTGDLVCQDLHGSFRYLGRADTQVKVNGVRIEVAEIESRIAEIDSSVTAVVAALDSGDGVESKTLVAFIGDGVSRKLSTPIRTEAFLEKGASIRGRLARILPRIMVPRVWVPLANVKRTSTGKLDRKVLQKVFETYQKTLSTEKPSNGNEVLTDAERTVRSLWASVLKCDQSKLHKSTNFFDLGDSITAIGLVAAAARLGYHISVGSLFKHSGLSEMALLIQDNHSTDSLIISQDPLSFSLLSPDALKSAREDLERGLPSHITIEDIYPVTPFQEMALVANQKWHHAYKAWFLVKLTGALDPSRLQDACNQLVDVHAILRTVFFQSGATLYQAPLQNFKPDYQETPWNGDKSCVPALIERSCSNQGRSCGSLTLFRLLQHTAAHSLLAIGLSHAQYDGLCLSNVLDHLMTIYNGNRVARQPSFSRLVQLLNLPTQVAAAQAFWSKKLRGSSMTKLVGDLNINRPLSDSIVTGHIQLPTPSTTKRAFHAVLCLAWAITLGSATGISDVVFGTLTSGRSASIKDISTLDGPCITTIPVRVKLDEHPPAGSSTDTMTLGQTLEQVHRDHIETLPYEHLGLRKIVKACTDWPSTTRFSSMVQHQNIGVWDPSSTNSASPTRPAADGDLQWRNRGSIAYKGGCDEVDLWITSLPMGEDGMKVRILFSQEALPREVVESLLSILCANLESILWNPDESVTTLSAKSIARLGGVRLPIERPQESQGPAQNETTSCTPEAPSQTSRLLQAIWCRVLELVPDKQFAASDSFYIQGGDSVGAAMVAGLAQAEGLSLNPQDVAECETFGAQVRRIEQGCRGVGRSNDLEWDVTDRMWGKDG